MELDRLRDAEAVARHGSIKKAAEELGVSSATLSARLLKLEERLGKPLFERCGTGLELTVEGQNFIPRVARLLDQYREALQNMRAAERNAYQRLRIAVSGSNLPLYLGPFLDRLNLTHPGIRLELLDDSRFGVVEGLRSGYADIFFAPVMEDFAPHGIVKSSVAPASQNVIMPRSHPLSERAMVSIQDLEGEQFILYPRTAENAIRDFQLRNLQSSGIHYTVYDGDTSVNFYKLLVPVGKGLLLIPHTMMDLPPNSVSIPVAPLPHPATVCYFHNENDHSENVRAFVSDFPLFVKELVSHEHGPSL